MKATRSAHTRCIRVAGSHSGNRGRPLPVEALRGLLLRGTPAVPRCVVGFWTWCRRQSSPAPGRERVGTAGCERDGNGTERERRPGRAAARPPDLRRVAPSHPDGVALARRRGDTGPGRRRRPGHRRGRRCGRPGHAGRGGCPGHRRRVRRRGSGEPAGCRGRVGFPGRWAGGFGCDGFSGRWAGRCGCDGRLGFAGGRRHGECVGFPGRWAGCCGRDGRCGCAGCVGRLGFAGCRGRGECGGLPGRVGWRRCAGRRKGVGSPG